MTNFQLFMPSPNVLRSKIPYTVGGGAHIDDDQFPTFDAEPKSARLQNYGFMFFRDLCDDRYFET